MAGSPQLSSSERFHDLDALRALAMFLGIVFHALLSFAFGAAPTDWPPESRVTEVGFSGAAFVLHAFRLHLFFLLAGFFAALVVQRRGLRSFARQRLERIALPLAVGTITIVPLSNVVLQWLDARRLDQPLNVDWRGAVALEPLHLWFLWYLLLFYVVMIGLDRLPVPRGLRVRGASLFRRLVASRLRLVPLTALAALILVNGPQWSIVVHPSFIPDPQSFALFFAFFAFGWLLHRLPGTLDQAAGQPWLDATVAVTACVAVVVLREAQGEVGGAPGAVGVALTALVGWSTTFALLGIGRRTLTRERPRVRWLADSSYWLYLAHFPLVFGLQALLAHWSVPLVLKLAVVLAVTVALLLLTYAYLVRPTFIGRVLNGPRRAGGWRRTRLQTAEGGP